MKPSLPLLLLTLANCVSTDDPNNPVCNPFVHCEDSMASVGIDIANRVGDQVPAAGGLVVFDIHTKLVKEITDVTSGSPGAATTLFAKASQFSLHTKTPAPVEVDIVGKTARDEPFSEKLTIVLFQVDTVSLGVRDYELATPDIVFAPAAKAQVQLHNANTVALLVDRTLAITGGTVDADDRDIVELPATPGAHAIQATADSFGTRMLDATVVDAAERVEAERLDPTQVCFHARAGAHEVIAPVWTLRKDGAAQTQLGANCLFFPTDDKGTLTGEALGKSATFKNP